MKYDFLDIYEDLYPHCSPSIDLVAHSHAQSSSVVATEYWFREFSLTQQFLCSLNYEILLPVEENNESMKEIYKGKIKNQYLFLQFYDAFLKFLCI